MIDFDECPDVFLSLHLDTAPVLMHFPAEGKRKPADVMDIRRNGVGAEALSIFVYQRTDIRIQVIRPPNYTKHLAFVSLGALIIGILYFQNNAFAFLYNKNLWGLLSVLFCFLMVTGQVWNHINGPAFKNRNRNGEISYIHRLPRQQFVIETYIVMALNVMIAFGLFLLIESRNRRNIDDKRVMVIGGLVFILIFFSILVSVFRSKFQIYPYRVLFK